MLRTNTISVQMSRHTADDAAIICVNGPRGDFLVRRSGAHAWRIWQVGDEDHFGSCYSRESALRAACALAGFAEGRGVGADRADG